MKLNFFKFRVYQIFVLVTFCCLLLAAWLPTIRQATQSARYAERISRVRKADQDLKQAVQDNDVELAREALEAEAKPELAMRDSLGLGRIEIVKLLLEFGADANDSAAKDSRILAALRSEQPAAIRQRLIRLLVEYGADPSPEHPGSDLMHYCLIDRDVAMAEFLTEFGYEYGAREMVALNQLERLRALVEKTPNVVHELVKPRSPPFEARRDRSLLGIALARGYRDMALFLIERGAELDPGADHNQRTLLHEAARGGHPELISLLVENGLDVNAEDEYGNTPLLLATRPAHSQAVKTLIEAGADVNASNSGGVTPLHDAASGGQVEIVRMLLAAGADPQIVSRDGQTALDWARRRDINLKSEVVSETVQILERVTTGSAQ